MSTESGGNTENGLAVVCVVGVVIYLACKLKNWSTFEQEESGDEEEKMPLFNYDLTNPSLDFVSAPVIEQNLVDHTFPIPGRAPSPIYFVPKRTPSPHMLTFQEMLNCGRVNSGDFLDRLTIASDHEVSALDWLLKENDINKKLSRSSTPGKRGVRRVRDSIARIGRVVGHTLRISRLPYPSTWAQEI